jgi:serine/threonine-protein kinase
MPPQSDWQASFSSLYSSASGFIATQKTPFLLFTGGVVIVVIFLIGVAGASLYIWLKSSTTTSSASNTKSAVKAELVAIPGGTFMMGRNNVSQDSKYYNEYPAHLVTVAPFYMDKTEVTNAEYAQFVHETNYGAPPHWQNNEPPAGQEQWPVTNVSFTDALAFAAWRSKRDGVQYRLPTEEEWEFAARGGSKNYLYPWGEQWRDGMANVGSDSLKPVGSYPQGASPWGVQDLIGNVWEWTASNVSSYAGNKGLPIEPEKQQWYITRGGSYKDKTPDEQGITATRRTASTPTMKREITGFRLVRKAS